MKTFIISITVLLILLTGISIYSCYLGGTVKDIDKSIAQVSEFAYKRDWENCKKSTEKLVDIFDKNEAILAMFNDHEDVDNIKLSIAELKESVLHENFEHTFKALEETKILLERIEKNENLTLENILGLAHIGTHCHNML